MTCISPCHRFEDSWNNQIHMGMGQTYYWSTSLSCIHTLDDVTKWKYFPRYWPFVRGIHRWSVNSPHKDQWRGALMFSLICAWINGWVNNSETGDLRRHRTHYYVIVMTFWLTRVVIVKGETEMKLLLGLGLNIWWWMIDGNCQNELFFRVQFNWVDNLIVLFVNVHSLYGGSEGGKWLQDVLWMRTAPHNSWKKALHSANNKTKAWMSVQHCDNTEIGDEFHFLFSWNAPNFNRKD